MDDDRHILEKLTERQAGKKTVKMEQWLLKEKNGNQTAGAEVRSRELELN